MHDLVVRKAVFSKLVAVTVAILAPREVFIQYFIISRRFLDYLRAVFQLD